MSRGTAAETVARIRALLAEGHSKPSIATACGVSKQTVYNVAAGWISVATSTDRFDLDSTSGTGVDTPAPTCSPTGPELRKKLRAGRSDSQLANALLDRQFALYGRRDPRYRNLLIMYGHGQEAELADMLLFDENMAAWAKRTGITPAPA
jgi:hypothetical protein